MFQKFSNEKLVESLHKVFQEERRIDLEVLRHLYEIERRKLYLQYSYPSLFEMCVGEFKLSHGSAQRRISAMRLLKEIPEVAPKLETGELSVMVMAQTATFLKAEKKKQQIYTKAEKLALVQSFENKSLREVEKDLAAKNPAILQYETVKPVSATQSKMTMVISHELKEKMDRLKDLKAHANPSMTYEGLFELLVEQELKRELKKIGEVQVRGENVEKSRQSQEIAKIGDTGESRLPALEVTSRRPSASLRRKIWRRDENQCTHADHKTGERCGAKAFLQIDHVKPYGIGGETSAENLRLLCASHNRARIQETFF